jgi:tRNA(fMet)-specific endonuclease VapC
VIRYLLDTNICIELIRERSTPAIKRVRQCQVGDIAISAITVSELEYGVAKSQAPQRNKLALAHFLAPLELASFDHQAAAAYGRIRARLEQSGAPIGPLDTLIAAHALALGVTLITNNQRDFRRVEGLVCEDWTRG